MFLHLSVSHSVHRGVSASVHAGIHPLGADTPQKQTPPQEVDTPLEADTPWKQTPPPPRSRHPLLLHSVCWGIRATNGRYASYWNAYLSSWQIHTNNERTYLWRIHGSAENASSPKLVAFFWACAPLPEILDPLRMWVFWGTDKSFEVM